MYRALDLLSGMRVANSTSAEASASIVKKGTKMVEKQPGGSQGGQPIARRWGLLAVDYDGTLAKDGVVRSDVVEALVRCRESGRRLVLVTGRELPELKAVFSHLELFDLVVCENGGLLFAPRDSSETPLATVPPPALVALLNSRNVTPLSVGRTIVATREPHDAAALTAIRELGLELQVIFNKGAVMLLPSGVNKASGLAVALERLGVSAERVVAVGDGENDHALLAFAGLGVAVANAVPMLCQRADWITSQSNGSGVIELIERLVAEDLAGMEAKPRTADPGAALPQSVSPTDHSPSTEPVS